MKYIIIALLLLSSCADKKEQETQTTTTIPQTNTTIPQIDTPIELSYDRGVELVLVDKNTSLYILLEGKGHHSEYHSIYWDKKNLNYYCASMEIYTNKVQYSLDSNLQHEPTIIKQYKEFIEEDVPLLYAGSISPLERIYVNTNKNYIYLKRLTLLDDDLYLSDGSVYTKTTPNNAPVFPIVYILEDEFMDKPLYATAYTNSNIYERYPRNKGILTIKHEDMHIDEYLLDAASWFVVTMVYPEKKSEFSK